MARKKKKKKKQVFYDLLETYTEHFIEAECPYADKCGGCMFQQLPYNLQLELKQNYLKDLLQDITDVGPVAAANPLHYRNRMDYVCAFDKIGLRERGSHRFVVNIENCLLLQKKSNTIFNTLHPAIKEIEGYNYLKHEGYLRYVILRQAYFTDEVMVNYVAADHDIRIQPLLEQTAELADSVSYMVHDGLADLSFGDITHVEKQGYITEKLDDIKFKITPNSFFQSNSYMALQMYSKIRELVKGKVLDLYSGVGSISLFVSNTAESVTAVELHEESVATANENKALNNIENTTFICSDAKPFMQEHVGEYTTLIMDPPRSGIHPKMIKHINEGQFEQIIYMSCNPKTFKDDVTNLDNYQLRSFEAFDMFPQTPHIETLALLTKK